MDSKTYGLNVALTRYLVSLGMLETHAVSIPEYAVGLTVSEPISLASGYQSAPIGQLTRAVYRLTGRMGRGQEYLTEFCEEIGLKPAKPPQAWKCRQKRGPK